MGIFQITGQNSNEDYSWGWGHSILYLKTKQLQLP